MALSDQERQRLETLEWIREQGIVAYCDILRLAALGGDPSLTPYGDYGRTCGGRNEPTETACVELYPV